jgi:hypothetical protein
MLAVIKPVTDVAVRGCRTSKSPTTMRVVVAKLTHIPIAVGIDSNPMSMTLIREPGALTQKVSQS